MRKQTKFVDPMNWPGHYDEEAVPVKQESCRTCRFWGGRFNVDIDGNCHRHAPAYKGGAIPDAKWPWVQEYQWCGDYELATIPENTESDEVVDA